MNIHIMSEKRRFSTYIVIYNVSLCECVTFTSSLADLIHDVFKR